jgi:N-methylhydantoinase A
VFVPARPGLTNALGCLVADLRQDFVQTLNKPVGDLDMEAVSAVLDDHAARGRAANADEAAEIIATDVVHAADMQFRGQTHLIRVALDRQQLTREALQLAFEQAYFRRFQVELPEVRAVLVNLVTTVIGRRRALDLGQLLDPARQAATAADARTGTRALYGAGVWHDAQIYERERLPRGGEITGPAIIQQSDATTIIEPGAIARVDALGNLRVLVGEGA